MQTFQHFHIEFFVKPRETCRTNRYNKLRKETSSPSPLKRVSPPPGTGAGGYKSVFYKSTFYKSMFYKSTFYKFTFYKSMFYKSTFYKSMFYKSTFYKSTFYKSTFYKSMFYKSMFTNPCFTNLPFTNPVHVLQIQSNPVHSIFYNMPNIFPLNEDLLDDAGVTAIS